MSPALQRPDVNKIAVQTVFVERGDFENVGSISEATQSVAVIPRADVGRDVSVFRIAHFFVTDLITPQILHI